MIGRLIDGRYQVRSRIARGGMATVYLATDLRLERKVAIKVMHAHLSDDLKFRERFIQEARSAARLAHPNVVNVFDQGQDDDMAYLVMEYLPGITLRDLLQENGRLTTDQTLDILEAVLAGLSAAHKAGILHRDLKPENVLLADDGRIKIGDFGLARAASANTATGAALLGTIAYLSPELVTRGVADTRSDIYAVGIMTYEMVTGDQPFIGEQPMQVAYQHANDTVPTPSTSNPRVPEEIDELVLWSTARDPEERPRDARVMLDEVHAIRSVLEPTPTSATAQQRTMVMPAAAVAAAFPLNDTNSATQIITPQRGRPAPVVSDAVDDLASKSRKRRGRGRWLLALVLVLAAVGAGTGWYFGAGPGANSTIPSVAGDTQTAARAALERAGLTVATKAGHESNDSILKGLVSSTNPKAGSALAKNGRVTLILSDGPKLISLPSLLGDTETVADSAITTAGFTVGSPTIQQFDSTVPKGEVLDYLDTKGKSIVNDTQYYQKQPIQLVISAGKLPVVRGMSLKDAESALKAVGLTAQPGDQVFSSSVPKDDVVDINMNGANGKPRTFRVGDTNVLLDISEGPQQVKVPSVVGDDWTDAKKDLLAAGFKLAYDHNADVAPGLVTVTATDPTGGTLADKHSTVTVTFNFQ
jgi:beta-lactam-binding protein with PASTA domain/tRNA A-37 threonylcarbamoyl transferase component Bud32